jgi:hypothetical protein
MRKFIAVAILASGMFLANPVGLSDTQQVKCEEDMPCWDCETMGNGLCGSTFSEMLVETIPGMLPS